MAAAAARRLLRPYGFTQTRCGSRSNDSYSQRRFDRRRIYHHGQRDAGAALLSKRKRVFDSVKSQQYLSIAQVRSTKRAKFLPP